MDDEATLRIKIYRSLGVTVDGKGGGEEQEVDGEYNRMIVRNMGGGKGGAGDVHVVKIEQGKYSRAFYAKFLWDRM
jgi:hypothetical protein